MLNQSKTVSTLNEMSGKIQQKYNVIYHPSVKEIFEVANESLVTSI